jgi:hypothetical protein
MSRPSFQVNKLSKSAKKRRRSSPLWRALKDLIGHDPQGATIAGLLFGAGITTPEELRKMAYGDLIKIPGIGRSALSRIASIRHQLNVIHNAGKGDTDDPDQSPSG